MSAVFWLIDTIIDIYIWLLIAQAILSWLLAFGVVNRWNRGVAVIGDFLYRVTEPLLRPIRSFLPNFGGVDISPVILILLLMFVRRLILYDLAPACSEAPGALPLAAAVDGVSVAVRLTPRGRADRIEGVVHLADGTPVLKASVGAPPEDGRANEALLRLLATEWGLARRDLTVVAGLKSRNKSVHVAGDPAALLARLGAAIAALPRE